MFISKQKLRMFLNCEYLPQENRISACISGLKSLKESPWASWDFTASQPRVFEDLWGMHVKPWDHTRGRWNCSVRGRTEMQVEVQFFFHLEFPYSFLLFTQPLDDFSSH